MKYNAVAEGKMSSLAVMNPDGTGTRELPIYGYDPSVSPDGTKIAYCSLRQDQYSQIYVANANAPAKNGSQ
jgi:Tol biopolymer transport system component